MNLNRNRISKFQDPETTYQNNSGSGAAALESTKILCFEKNRAAAKIKRKQLSQDVSKNFRGLIQQEGSKCVLTISTHADRTDIISWANTNPSREAVPLTAHIPVGMVQIK